MTNQEFSQDVLPLFSRVLVLCPHVDDELGCGGTIWRLVRMGTKVRYLSLSKCEASVPAPWPKDVLVGECMACTKKLGLKPENVRILDYPVRHFPAHRQDILENLVAINRDYAPDLVLMPSFLDTHQDHKTVCQEGFRAFKYSTLLGYEMPQNLVSFNNTAFSVLSQEDLDAKIEAVSCYESQKFRPYSSPEFITSLARVRGVQCNKLYAEAFEVIRLIF